MAIHELTCRGPMPLRVVDLPLAEPLIRSPPRVIPPPHANIGGDVVTAGGMVSSMGNVARNLVMNQQVEKAPAATTTANATGVVDQHNALSTAASTTSGVTQHGNNEQVKRRLEDTVDTRKDQSSGAAKRGPTSSETKSQPPPKKSKKETEEKEVIDVVDEITSSSKDDVKNTKDKNGVWTTVWTCDICNNEQFTSFEGACEHERTCQGKKEDKPQDQPIALEKKGPLQDVKTTPASSPSNVSSKLTTLFSPLSDSADSVNFSKLSKNHQIMLSSLKILHRQVKSSSEECGAVSFQCQFCSHPYPPVDGEVSWTLDDVKKVLPALVDSHLLGCKSSSFDNKEPSSLVDASGNMSLDEFLSSYFRDNGIVDRLDGRGVIAVSDENFLKAAGSTNTKRGKQLTSKKKERKSNTDSATKQQKKPPSKKASSARSKHEEIFYGDMGCTIMREEEGGHLFRVAPLDGLPFLSTFSQHESKKLHTSLKFLLQQFELFSLYPKLMKSTNTKTPQAVGIRCRGCIVDKNGCCFMKLSSVKNIARDVLLLTKEHVMSCKFMKAKYAKLIQDLLKEDHTSVLDKYCNFVAKLYSLEEATDGSDKADVIFGQSPKVTGGYCKPSDIDVSTLIEPEAESPEKEVASRKIS